MFFRDTRDILEVVLPMLFWATPIFYLPEMAPRFLQPALRLNPLTELHRRHASGGDERASENPTVTQLGWMVVLGGRRRYVSGIWVFLRYRPRFAEEA